MRYEICVEGSLDHNWSQWFGGLVVETVAGNRTTLTGDVVDQAALHGVLDQVRDLGLEVVSVIRIDDEATP